MEYIREYLLSVTAAALLCGILQNLVGQKSSSAGILKLVCGIFLCFTVIRPIADIRIQEIPLIPTDILSDAQTAVEEGEDYAKQAMVRLIKEQTEAYILDKAKLYGARITVEVSVAGDDPPVPVSVTISGQITPYARQQLKAMLETDLNIPEEDQKWITSNQSS